MIQKIHKQMCLREYLRSIGIKEINRKPYDKLPYKLQVRPKDYNYLLSVCKLDMDNNLATHTGTTGNMQKIYLSRTVFTIDSLHTTNMSVRDTVIGCWWQSDTLEVFNIPHLKDFK